MLQSLNPKPSQYPDAMIFPATLGRRFIALLVDWWIVSFPIMALLVPNSSQATLPIQISIFAFEVVVMTFLTGGSVGQLPLKLRVLDMESGQRPTLLQIIIRTALIVLVLPTIFTREGRGYHDVLARTQIVKIAAA